MDREELLETLRRLVAETADGEDEEAHIEADKALLEYIGDAEVTRTFDEIGKWYA